MYEIFIFIFLDDMGLEYVKLKFFGLLYKVYFFYFDNFI